MNVSLLAALWILSGLLGGGGDCRFAEERGVRTMRQIGEQWPLRSVEDPVSKYVQRVGLRLARVVDPGSSQPWDFYVVRNAVPSAFAVGGGHFLISDGLLAFVGNESELAAVLAHEIAHQTLGHFCRGTSPAVEQIDRGTVVQHYDRETEMEADGEAIHLLTAAGFDPNAMQSVLRCLGRLPSTGGSHLSKRVRALGKQRERGELRGHAPSPAFGRAQSSVEEDLGTSVRQKCR